MPEILENTLPWSLSCSSVRYKRVVPKKRLLRNCQPQHYPSVTPAFPVSAKQLEITNSAADFHTTTRSPSQTRTRTETPTMCTMEKT